MQIQLPAYLTEKEGLLYVRTHDAHYLHQSFLLEGGKVLVFESIPSNYPSNALCIHKDVKTYLESIQDVDWINDTDYIVRHNLEAHGFPFADTEE